MADPKKMTVEEVIAACRKMDGGEGGGAPESAPAEPESAVEEATTAAPEPAEAQETKPATPAAGKKPGEMSVADMLAAARAEKEGGGEKAAAKQEKPKAAPKPAAAGKKPGEMSVADILAAARADKEAGAKAAPKEKAAAKASPKEKPAAKAAPKTPAAKSEGPKDTTSILAAAHKPAKPGPVSKAEAAAKAAPAAPAEKKGKPKVEVPPMPEKPGYARPEPAAADGDQTDRRGFFSRTVEVLAGSPVAIGFTSLALTSMLGTLGFARFMFPNILTEPPTKFRVGFPDDYAPGQVETKYKAQFGVWIARFEYEGVSQIYALQSVCTHLGCTPNWLEGEQKFKCPCHGSGFYKDGINFEGPAPRPLERFAIRLADDGQLEVDKSRKFLEEKGEWKDPASFVPV